MDLNSVVLIVATCPLILKLSNPFTKSLQMFFTLANYKLQDSYFRLMRIKNAISKIE